MIFKLPLIFLGALTFIEQDLTMPCQLDSYLERGWNYLCADLDGDGHKDLVFPTFIWFQRDGLFPVEARVATPGAKEHALVDCLGNTLYVRYKERLELYQWKQGSPEIIHKQEMAWPKREPEDERYEYYWKETENAEFTFVQRFLTDIDRDEIPEIVLLGEDALHVYVRSKEGYSEASQLDLIPAFRPSIFYGRHLWPDSLRTPTVPFRRRLFSYAVDADHVTIVSQEPWSEMQIRYRVKRFRIDPSQGFTAVPDETAEELSEPLPIRNNWSRWEARRMNASVPLDYTAAYYSQSQGSVLPLPVLETSITTDGGKTIQTVRTQHATPHESFLDFNEDGLVDRVTWSAPMFSVGIREIVNFILNGNKFTEEVQIAFQDAKGGFPEKPNVSGRFTIRVDKAPIRGGFAYARYERGGTCDLGGDFNGDGLRDMAIADGPSRVSIYLCEGATFAGEPFMTATIQEDSDFSVTDIDGDGHPDIMTVYDEKQEGKYVTKRRAYLSREAPPQ